MNYVNIGVIADRLKRNKLLDDLLFETIIDNTLEFIKIVGIPKVFFDKVGLVDIDDYRGVLPCDLYKINQVRDKNGICYRYTTDSFHYVSSGKGQTYKTQGRFIFTSVPKATLEISYIALPVDDSGLPLIPDNGTYPRALQEYIKLEHYTTLFEEGRITGDVLKNTQQRYAFYVAQASSDLVMPTIDEMESLTALWNNPLIRNNFPDGFAHAGVYSTIKTQ